MQKVLIRVALALGWLVLLLVWARAETNSPPSVPISGVWIRSGTNALAAVTPWTNTPAVLTVHVSEHFPLLVEVDTLGNKVGRELHDPAVYGNTIAIYTDGSDPGRIFAARIPIGSTNRGDQPFTPPR